MSGSWPALAPHVACSFVLLLGIFAGPISAYEFADSDHYYHSYETGYMSDFGQDWNIFNGRLNQPKCIDIPKNLTLCRDIGYTQMRLPNLLDHDSIREVTQQASTWVSLINIQCHPDTQLFLCSLFSPVCLNRPIPPCRNLCLAVKEGCSSKMKFYGFPWPDMLRCDKFPLENDLCIGPQTDNKPGKLKPSDGMHTIIFVVANFWTQFWNGCLPVQLSCLITYLYSLDWAISLISLQCIQASVLTGNLLLYQRHSPHILLTSPFSKWIFYMVTPNNPKLDLAYLRDWYFFLLGCLLSHVWHHTTRIKVNEYSYKLTMYNE